MKIPEHCVLDFETMPIQPRPNFPPKPVGVALRTPWAAGRYYAWGHPTKNNCHVDDAMRELERVWDSGLPILFHNAKFDTSVAYEGLGAPRLPWERIHDTTFLAFLVDPHARSLGLKELAQDWLNWPAEERDAMGEWLWNHRKSLNETYGIKLSRSNGKVVKASMYTAYVPGDIASAYAVGDIDRTDGLFTELLPLVERHGMMEAYNRERELMPILQANEETGMLVDIAALRHDIPVFRNHFSKAERWIRGALHSPELNIDADKDVADALLSQGIVPEENWTLTEGGQLCMKKDVLLPEHFSGHGGVEIASVLGYRNRLMTCLNMFMMPWAQQAEARNGYVSTNWNQIRGVGGGTRTGRPSTNDPNFLNISKSWDDKKDGYVHPAFLGLSPLPLVRGYVLPDEGCEFLHRDFDGQELRVFAHFEQGALMRAYLADPNLDPHAFVGAQLMELAGVEMDRTKIKVMNFQSIYGGGLKAIQDKMHISRAQAKEYKEFHNAALPGRKILDDTIKEVVGSGDPIRTWGGRLYYPEEPRIVKGRRMTWEYKLINYIVQGSAADITKQAIIEWHRDADRRARFMITVYDEINISAEKGGTADAQMALLKRHMNKDRLDVPMTTAGKCGPSWGKLEKCT